MTFSIMIYDKCGIPAAICRAPTKSRNFLLSSIILQRLIYKFMQNDSVCFKTAYIRIPYVRKAAERRRGMRIIRMAILCI